MLKPRKKTPPAPDKQAVVVIHGMGEQTPMTTLKDFVETVWARDGDLTKHVRWRPDWPKPRKDQDADDNAYWIVPDSKSGSFELWRIATPENNKHVRTDFFEFYWADITANNKFGVLWAWLRRIMVRSPSEIPRGVLPIWILLWMFGIALVLLGLAAIFTYFQLQNTSRFHHYVIPGLNGLAKIVVLLEIMVTFLPIMLMVRNSGFSWRTGAYLVGLIVFTLAVYLTFDWSWLQVQSCHQDVSPNGLPDWLFCTYPLIFLTTALGIIASVVAYFVLPYFGDVAQYTFATPETVANRQEIRRRGLQLLDALHESGRYTRIVLVGHSLGSIIAYDLIQFLWAERGPSAENPPPAAAMELLHAIDEMARSVPAERNRDAWEQQYWQLQRKFAAALTQSPKPWLITDLVTLGSPLTHAQFMIADSKSKFEQARDERIFNFCPPVQDWRLKNEPRSIDRFPPQSVKSIMFWDDGKLFPHHAAPFAAVRWSNIFDKRFFLVFGDLIGGRLQGLFGPGIRDMEAKIEWFRLPGKLSNWRRFMPHFFTHTHYWTYEKGDHKPPHHIQALRRALNLLDDCPPASRPSK